MVSIEDRLVKQHKDQEKAFHKSIIDHMIESNRRELIYFICTGRKFPPLKGLTAEDVFAMDLKEMITLQVAMVEYLVTHSASYHGIDPAVWKKNKAIWDTLYGSKDSKEVE